MAETTLNSFEDITGRMDEIIAAVRSKDTSLERSLDLFDEAIALGSHAVELVDSFDPRRARWRRREASPMRPLPSPTPLRGRSPKPPSRDAASDEARPPR